MSGKDFGTNHGSLMAQALALYCLIRPFLASSTVDTIQC
jgi:hypothetical protein